MTATFDHSEVIASHIQTFWFRPSKPVQYLAGQYTELRLEHPNVDDRGNNRWFTLSSSPSEKLLSITTKFSQPGSTYKHALQALTPGTIVHLADPMGDFVLPKDSTIPLVFVAAGMGITPVRSIIKWLADTKEKRDITLLYVAARSQELAFLPLLKAHSHIAFIGNRHDDGEQATLSAERIIKLAKPTPQAHIYLSGPEPMIETLNDQFGKLQYPQNQLITDYFPGYTPI